MGIKVRRSTVKFDVKGNPNGPLVVCVHGLMGAASDFGPYAEAWGRDFNLLIPHLTENDTLNEGFGKIVDGVERLVYEFSGEQIIAHLKEFYPGQKPFFVGISYGGKIILDIAESYPECFSGCAVTDVGLGPLSKDSGLFHFVYEVIPGINFDQPWANLRKDLVRDIPDQMLRILIQQHIEYPDKSVPKGRWKGHSRNFHHLLANCRLEDLWAKADRIAAPIYIFKATVQSAISAEDFARMKDIKWFNFETVEGANHFIQINRIEEFRERTLKILQQELLHK
jgi:pimeloyl-ACP methyl ester carboxylesterase